MNDVRNPDINSPARRDRSRGGGSYLVDETFLMEQQRRLEEQNGHRHYAKVNAIEHFEQDRAAVAPEGELQNDIKDEHPYLQTQLNDGTDVNLNRIPAMNTAAKEKYDKAKEEQKNELQHRLGLSMKYKSTPEFRP